MIYFIVVNEWQYPNNTGREIVNDFDTLEEAEIAAETEYQNELDNFLEVNNGEMYREACGKLIDVNYEPIGYVMNSSQHESENMFFRSIIIKREV